jgi:glycosyltransferase involved in cell wall biosynthesis/predicted SAM-dependent methyltransferase
MSTYEDYLLAADVAVQLRTSSRGETSKAALDCLAHGLPTVINDSGTLSDFPAGVAIKLKADFEDAELSATLRQLHSEPDLRARLGEGAINYVREHHHPEKIGALYHQAIEQFYASGEQTLRTDLIQKISLLGEPLSDEDVIQASQSIAVGLPKVRKPELLLDISATERNDLKTGIERVARALVSEFISNPPDGYRVEPVYLSENGDGWHYRYARKYTLGLFGVVEKGLEDSVVDPIQGDVLVGLDIFHGVIEAEKSGLYQRWRNRGVSLNFVVYDLLPVLRPDFFPPGSDQSHSAWLNTLARFADGLVGISKSVADELNDWLGPLSFARRPLDIGYFHLGADIGSSVPTKGLESDAEQLIEKLKSAPTFLMVGTLEPRKGHLQTIAAFEQLWERGISANLLIVGNEGWKGLSDRHRRTIPAMIAKLRKHPELGKHLFWLQGISDEYLLKIYAASTCLLAPSEGEGFGLPLIEAAQHGLPIIARDTPVFREVAGDSAYYFSGNDADSLAAVVQSWMRQYVENHVPASGGIEIMTWKQTAKQLIRNVLGHKWYTRKFGPSPKELAVEKEALERHGLLIHAARLELIKAHLPPAAQIIDLGGANSPLHKMGYPHRFAKLTMIDLPPTGRHEYYKDVVVDTTSENGQVVVKFGDMTDLQSFADESIDLVWSGQSIEHVSEEAGTRMCQEAFRVLRRGGSFCLDTPNRLLTAIHTQDIGGGFIHPEHCIEYTPKQLKGVLEAAGFHLTSSLGVCEMPSTVITGRFHYADFITGRRISENVDRSYIQYFHCVKPG